eukprot:65996_1
MAQADYVMSVMVKPMDCDSAMLKKLRKEMKKQMRLRYLNKIHDIHWKCTLLCPAYRNKTFLKRQYFMDKGTRVYFIASKRADVIASIKEDIVLIKKYDTYLEAQQRLNRSTSESDFVMDDPDAPEEQTRTNFCDLLGYSDDEEDEEDVQGQDEVDTYLALNISSHDRSLSKDNPLAWWSNADSRFGLVYLKRLTARLSVFETEGVDEDEYEEENEPKEEAQDAIVKDEEMVADDGMHWIEGNDNWERDMPYDELRRWKIVWKTYFGIQKTFPNLEQDMDELWAL